jgi:hypothetical protein
MINAAELLLRGALEAQLEAFGSPQRREHIANQLAAH